MKEKFNAIVEDIHTESTAGRPVLVGTVSIEKSEALSQALTRRYGIEHEVLNAKQHAREAVIVEKAGHQHEARDGSMRGNVTIATNMAGRGTDIKLGDGVADLGGLHILGTERHESRRIDNQLRGRAGRQGDAGSSVFFLSFDDDLMRIFGSERIDSMLQKLGLEDCETTLASLHDLCHRDTRLVIAYYAKSWEPLLRLAESMGGKMPKRSRTWSSKRMRPRTVVNESSSLRYPCRTPRCRAWRT